MRKPSLTIGYQVGLFSSQAQPVSPEPHLAPIVKEKATGSGVSLSRQILVKFQKTSES